jgi:LytS/YehU family sensor histidine kinase
MQARVPYLILQPLAENAVRHAAAEREEGGLVVVRAARENGSLWLSVEDDGPGLQSTPSAPHGSRTGLGLSNTRERMAQRFGAEQRVILERSALGGLRVALELPYRT